MTKAQGQAAGGQESVTEKEQSLQRRKEPTCHCPLQGMGTERTKNNHLEWVLKEEASRIAFFKWDRQKCSLGMSSKKPVHPWVTCPRDNVLGEIIWLSLGNIDPKRGIGQTKEGCGFFTFHGGRCEPGVPLPKREHKIRRGFSQKEIGDLIEKRNECWASKNDHCPECQLRQQKNPKVEMAL